MTAIVESTRQQAHDWEWRRLLSPGTYEVDGDRIVRLASVPGAPLPFNRVVMVAAIINPAGGRTLWIMDRETGIVLADHPPAHMWQYADWPSPEDVEVLRQACGK